MYLTNSCIFIFLIYPYLFSRDFCFNPLVALSEVVDFF